MMRFLMFAGGGVLLLACIVFGIILYMQSAEAIMITSEPVRYTAGTTLRVGWNSPHAIVPDTIVFFQGKML